MATAKKIKGIPQGYNYRGYVIAKGSSIIAGNVANDNPKDWFIGKDVPSFEDVEWIEITSSLKDSKEWIDIKVDYDIPPTLTENRLEARWDDLVDFVQKGRYLCIYQKGTDGLVDKIKGTGPWYTYTTQEWSNADQRFIKLPEKITHTWTADHVRKVYNERMKESWVMSHACDF